MNTTAKKNRIKKVTKLKRSPKISTPGSTTGKSAPARSHLYMVTVGEGGQPTRYGIGSDQNKGKTILCRVVDPSGKYTQEFVTGIIFRSLQKKLVNVQPRGAKSGNYTLHGNFTVDIEKVDEVVPLDPSFPSISVMDVSGSK